MDRFQRVMLLFVVVLLCQGASFAYGCEGHQIVALIAERLLTKNATGQVNALLHAATLYNGVDRACSDTALGDMAKYATWADDFRNTNEGAHTKPWHFWDVPIIANSAQETEFCDQGCVIKAINDSIKTLKTSDDTTVKTEALAMLIHFMGDLHQPLHIANNNDRGGNCFPLKFFGQSPKKGSRGYAPELHGIWDSQIVQKVGKIRNKSRDEDIPEFVDSLMSEFEKDIDSWQKQKIQIVPWALQSHEAAVTKAYGELKPTLVKAEKPENPEPTKCTDEENDKMLGLHEVVNQAYIDAVAPTLKEELAKGGTRLAMVLNDIWK